MLIIKNRKFFALANSLAKRAGYVTELAPESRIKFIITKKTASVKVSSDTICNFLAMRWKVPANSTADETQ